MKEQQLKDAIEQVNIPDEMQKRIARNLCRQTVDGAYHYKYKAKNLKKSLLAAAALILVAGTVSIPVQAGIRYLVKQRMESIPQEEMEAILEMQKTQNINGNGFSREYSQKELERKAELFRAYQKGTFPQGQLLVVETEEQVQADALCYVTVTGVFYLPDRELTDEELLEIIDFDTKEIYSLALDPEVSAFQEQQQEEQLHIQSKVQAEGGISQADAVAIAQKWMNSFFKVSTDGMEETIYLDEEFFSVPIYHITYDIRSNCYYYFSISTIDGTLMSMDVSIPGMGELDITETQLKEQIPASGQAAVKFMKEQLGFQDDFKTVTCLYRTENGELVSWYLPCYLTDEAGIIHEVRFLNNTNEFFSYKQVSLESYQERINQEGVTAVTLDLQP